MRACLRCHVDYYHNPEVRVFYSGVCNHQVCERCLAQVARDGTCPGCGQRVRAEDFSEQPREAREVESELKIRRQIREIYCKTESDFASGEEWDEYLVLREDIIYKLSHPASQEEAQDTKRQVERYKAQNAEQIKRTQQNRLRNSVNKVAGIIEKEGSFANRVNADWSQRSQASQEHALKSQHDELLSLLPKSPVMTRAMPTEPAASPPIAPQALLGLHGPAGKARQMSGGGQPPGLSVKKARHFFLQDLAAASRRRVVASCA
eukprot:TRINITY_DN14294_c1_g1_i1.p1 TRINITY_DN14294_c1_g1~~TRINITY_DN14294_c1_g1_i1.p1  ORF type:complete len:263 (-),score=35.91 TRINITY_DN14294_c1_g1_i1:64-852(-)